MKKAPMILLLIAPYAIVVVCYQLDLDLVIGTCGYAGLILFNMVYAFRLPGLGFDGKQILRWNLLLKLCNIPLEALIAVFALVMTLAGGKVHFWFLGILAALAYLVQLSSSVFGISGLRWYRKKGMLSEGAQAVAVATQFVPCVDIVGTILCCALLGRKEKDEDQKANAAV